MDGKILKRFSEEILLTGIFSFFKVKTSFVY